MGTDEWGTFDVGGCPIRWCARGSDRAAAVVLVHGARSHRHWWDPTVAAGLGDDDRRTVAFDLSGHGDSGRRPTYSPELWGDEAAAAIEECVGGPAALVGHSMGGLVALVAAARRPDLVSSLVLVDVRIGIPEPGSEKEPRGTPAKTLRTFPSREAAIESIRLFPKQPVVDARAVRHVAKHSIGPTDGGEWGWKFDPAVARRFDDETINRYLKEVECPVAMVYGAESALVGPESPRAAAEILGRPVPAVAIEGAHHHLILDRPAAAAAAIGAALAAIDEGGPPSG